MLMLMVAMEEEEETEELGVNILWMSQPQLFFLVEISQFLISVPVTMHSHFPPAWWIPIHNRI